MERTTQHVACEKGDQCCQKTKKEKDTTILGGKSTRRSRGSYVEPRQE